MVRGKKKSIAAVLKIILKVLSAQKAFLGKNCKIYSFL
jgi:hypothetical protein